MKPRSCSERLFCIFLVAASFLLPAQGDCVGVVYAPTEAALTSALTNGGIVTLNCDGTIPFSGAKTISADTVIDASGHSILFNGQESVQLFVVNPGHTLILSNLSLANGFTVGNGGAISNSGTLIAYGCIFANDFAIGPNGTNGAAGRSSTNSTGGTGQAGSKGGSVSGGAIYNAGSLVLMDCQFLRNGAAGGFGGNGGAGGSGWLGGGNGGKGGTGGDAIGGAIFSTNAIANTNTVFVTNCTFYENLCIAGDGGQGGDYGAPIPGAPFGGGQGGGGGPGGEGSGAGVHVQQQSVIANSSFYGNTANGGNGGDCGFQAAGANPGPDGSSGGVSRGGGIHNTGTNSLINCTFYTNSVTGGAGGNGSGNGSGGAGGNGGGGGLWSSSKVGVTNCTFSTCSATGGAGGAHGSGGTGSNGGAGGSNGGDISRDSGPFTWKNSIIAYAPHGGNGGGNSPITDAGNNISSDTSISMGGTGSLSNHDPKLNALSQNGGLTLTCSLQTNSPAINAGNDSAAPQQDQRGYFRVGTSDIGACEYNGYNGKIGVIAVGPSASLDGDVGVFFVEQNSNTTAIPLMINFAMSGSASNGVDYVQITNVVTIPANSTGARVLVRGIPGAFYGTNKTVTLTILPGTGYSVSRNLPSDTVIIHDHSTFDPSKRFVRGTSSAPAFQSVVIPTDSQIGIALDPIAGNATNFFPNNLWTNTLFHFNATNLASQTATNNRIPFQNPLVAFGSPVGGSPLYLNRNYHFGIAAGEYLNTSALRIQVYYRSNSALAGTTTLTIPNFSLTNNIQQWTTNGFTSTFSGFGLQTTIFFDPALVWWGAYYETPFFLDHVASATATNYYYEVDEQSTAIDDNLVLNQSNTSDWTRLYVMEFSPSPTNVSPFLNAPQFSGAPLPPAYQGKTLQELTNMAPVLPNLSFLTPSNYLTIDDSPELRRHPTLDQFVKDMGNDPIALANYVINEVDLIDAMDYDSNYNSQAVLNLGGVNRSALATFEEGEGSPMEQCALLVYLLRQSGVPAAYVFPTNGSLQMLDFQLSKLLGMQLNGAVNEWGETNVPQLITVNYPWVAAYIGTNWVQIFPWLKDTEVVEGLNLDDYMPTNYNSGYKWLRAFISNDTNIFSLSTTSDQPLDLLPLFIQNNLDKNYPGISVDDIGVKITNRRHLYSAWSDFPKPFMVMTNTPIVVESLKTNLNLFNTVQIEVFSQNNPNKLIDTTELYTADMHNRMLCLRFQQIGASNLHNMILSLAPYSSNTTSIASFSTNANPTWHLITTNVLDGTDDGLIFQVTRRRLRFLPTNYVSPAFFAESNIFGYDYFEAGQSGQQLGGQVFQDIERFFRKGDVVTFCADVGRVSQQMLDVHAQTIWQYNQTANTNDPTTLDPEVYLGETTYLMGMSYWNYVDRFVALDSQLNKVRFISWYQHGYGLIRPVRDSSGNLPNDGNVIPAIPAVHMPYSGEATLFNESLHPDSGDSYGHPRIDWWFHFAAQGSAAEHGVLRSYLNTNAISTVKLLQQHGFVDLNPANYIAAGQITYNGSPLQNADPSIWSGIESTLSSGDPVCEAFITPGVVTSGSYTGVGAAIISLNSLDFAVGGLNGGYGDQLPTGTFTDTNSVYFTVNSAPADAVSRYELQYGSPLNNSDYQVHGATTTWSQPATYAVLEADEVIVDPSLTQAQQEEAMQARNDADLYNLLYNTGTQGTASSYYRGTGTVVNEPVDVLTGEFYIDTADLTLPGPMPLQIRRNYGSQNLAENQFGFGWKTDYAPFLSVGTNSILIYAAEMDGSFIGYRQTPTNTNLWVPEPQDNPNLNNNSSIGIGSTGNLFNNRLTLSTATGTNVYTLSGADGSVRIFTERSYPVGTFDRDRPYLNTWQDSRGNSYAFQYGTDPSQPDYGEVRRIQSSNGSFLGFYYDVYGHIIEAYTGDGRILSYVYDQFGDLTSVTLPDQSQITYSYQHLNSVTNGVTNLYSTHLVVQEQKPDGRLVENIYDSQRRVTNQMLTVGSDLNPIRTATFVYTNNFNLSSMTNLLTGATWVFDYTNHVTSYCYTNSLVRKIIDPLGGAIVQNWFETNSPGGFQRSLQSVTDKRGLQTAYLYDSFGNPTNITVTGDLLGNGSTTNAVTSATYNANNLPLTITDPVGNGVAVVYDTNFVFLPQQVIKFAGATAVSTNLAVYVNVTNVVTLGSSQSTNTAFGVRQRQIRAIGSPDAATNDSYYNGQGFPTNSVQYTGTGDPNVTNQLFYDERGNLVQRTDAAGRNFLFDFDPMGRPTLKETYDIGQSQPMDWTYLYYNDNGEVNWIDGPRFNPEDYIFKDYDGAGRVTTEIRWQSEAKTDGTGVEAKSGNNLYAQTFYQYDPLGDLTEITDPLGNSSLKHYDFLGQLVREEFYDSTGTLLSTNGFVRNLAGDVTNSFNPLGGQTEKQYTSTGKLKFQQNPDGSTNAWLYYVDGRIHREFQRNGAFLDTTYDDADRITTNIFYSVSGQPLATNLTIVDRRGNVIQKTDAAGNTYTNLFDGLDRLKIAAAPPVLPGSQQITTNFYDSAGIVVTNADALGERVVTHFDPLSRPTLVQYFSAGSTLVRQTGYSYSADHNSVTITNGSGATAVVSTSFTDTENRNVLSIAYPFANSTQFKLRTFDLAGNLLSEIAESATNSALTVWQTNSSTYDGLNRPSSKTERDGAITFFRYDAAGDLTNRAMPESLSWTASYNDAGEILTESDQSSGQSTRNVTYGYYLAGNMWVGLLDTVTDNRGVTRTNSYDDYLRVATVATTGASPQQQMSCAWQYDVRGLLTNITQAFASTNTGLTTVISRQYNQDKELVSENVSPGGTIIQSWDAAGRRLSSGNQNFQYQADGQMTAASGSTFAYDLNGLLIGRTNGSRVVTINQRDGAGRPLQATTVLGLETILAENWSWTGDGLPASYTAARSDFTDARRFSYGSLTRRLTQETLNLNSSQSVTNVYTFDDGISAGLGVLTTVAEGSNSWNGSVDAFSRISDETNSVIHRTASGTVNGAATLRGYLNGQPLNLSYDPHAASLWLADMAVTSGTNVLSVYADHPSGLFTTNRTSTFNVTAGSFDNEQSLYDGAGNVTNRVWKRANGTIVRTQSLTWDAFGNLVNVTDLDATNNGYNIISIFDGMGRQAQTIETTISNNVALATDPAPVVVTYTYDPQFKFFLVGIGISQGDSTRQDSLFYGPDISGSYGGTEGIGGLETISTTVSNVNTTAVPINDCFGDVLGAITNGTVSWNPARLSLYAPVEGYAPPRLSLDAPAYASLAWRTRPVTAAGYVQLGARPYDWTRRAFLSGDPLGHASDPALNVAFAGNPAFYFDPDGLSPYSPNIDGRPPALIQDAGMVGDAIWNTLLIGLFGQNPDGMTQQQYDAWMQSDIDAAGSPFMKMGFYDQTPQNQALTQGIPAAAGTSAQGAIFAYGVGEATTETTVEVPPANYLGPQTTFYGTSDGTVVPATMYTAMGPKALAAAAAGGGVIDPNPNTGVTYGTFDNISPLPQVNISDVLQLGSPKTQIAVYDTLQILPDIKIPMENWNTGTVPEPFATSQPKNGAGEGTQAITQLPIQGYALLPVLQQNAPPQSITLQHPMPVVKY